MRYDKLEQSLFTTFNGMDGLFDYARELLRKIYPVGTILEACLWEHHRAQRFEVVEVSKDGYDLHTIDTIKVRALDGSGEAMAELHWNKPEHAIKVISRPKPEVITHFEI